MLDLKREKLMKKLENHLRNISRQIVKFDTEEEVCQYLTDTFRSELYCDFVGVILNKGDSYMPIAWSGSESNLTNCFPLAIEQCSSEILSQSLTYENANSSCHLSSSLKKANVKTWFTVPINEYHIKFGFCVVGYFNYVPLLDMGTTFDEFGKDIAVALSMARQKKLQLKKIEGIEWISQNLSLNEPLEKRIAELTNRARIRTNADFSCIYLYNEKEQCFVFQPPSYGKMQAPNIIKVEDTYQLETYFPFLEKPGGRQLTISLIVDVKTIGVLHVENKDEHKFTEEDVRALKAISDQVATILENVRLYNNEVDHRNRLRDLLDYQQALMKETVEVNDFDGIIMMLSELFQQPVVLFDRFLRIISCHFHEERHRDLEALSRLAKPEIGNMRIEDCFTMQDPMNEAEFYSAWKINGGGSLLGYLAVRKSAVDMDENDLLSIELARNICSIQFIKKKLVLDAKEQMKESFVSRLLTKNIEDGATVLQYANLFQWDLFKPHQVAVISISLDEKETEKTNLLEQQAKKSAIWDYLKYRITDKYDEILAAYFNEKGILFIPMEESRTWPTFYNQLKQYARETNIGCTLLMGVGSKADELVAYYNSFLQATQAFNIVSSRFRHKGFSLFDELGSYVVLHQLQHSSATELFVNQQLSPLLRYTTDKNMDLYNTLYTYLHNNGNVKAAADELFIHRSSLLYRLEKIEELLNVPLQDAEVRFNLMMAFKLYEMNNAQI